jgi:hypothetical protein
METSADIRILEIFNEFKTQKIIDPRRKIIANTKQLGTFRASISFFNTISFNPKMCEDLPDDVIRFCLLHEEGHLVRGQFGTPALALLWGIGLIPLLYCILSRINGIIFIISLCFTLFVVFSSIQILKQPFNWDECGSDEFASKILRDKYGVKKPSEVLEKTLKTYPQLSIVQISFTDLF